MESYVNREIEPKIQENLIELSSYLEELVDFSAEVINWDIEKNKGEDEALTFILFYRKYFQVIDSISLLIKSGSSDSCRILLRASLEAMLGILYLLEENTYDRSMAYLVCRNRGMIKYYSKLDPETPSGKQLSKKLDQDTNMNDEELINPEIPRKLKANLEKLLATEKYLKFNQEYDNQEKAKNKNPNWYSFYNGPRNVEQLAGHLNYQGLYELIYRTWSKDVHSSDLISGNIIPSKEGVRIPALRDSLKCTSIVSLASSLTLRVFESVHTKRLQNKESEFKAFYEKITEYHKSLQLGGEI